MPGVNPNADQFQIGYLRQLDTRLRALETQQKLLVTDAAGRVVEELGLQADGTFGLVNFDAEGRERVRLGQLPGGDYGLRVTDPAGIAREVLPVAAASTEGDLTTSSTSLVALAGSPSVSAYIGASGDALVTVSATILTPTITSPADVGGSIALSVDGSSSGLNWVQAGFNGGSYPSALPATQWPVSSAQLLSQTVGTVAPGEHTFGLEYASLGAGKSVTFFAIAIVVQPI